MHPSESALDPRAEYTRRLAAWGQRIAAHERTHAVLANCRLATAALAALVAVLSIRTALSAWWLLVPAAVFAILVVVHAQVLERADRARRARALYERGLDRLSNRWAGTGRNGARFLDRHPYAKDIDLFGTGSLFERLNTTRSDAGEATLAAWIQAGAPVSEARARQTAVAELRPRLDFREDLTALEADAQRGDTERLLSWAESTPFICGRAVPALLGLSAAITLTLAAALWWTAAAWPALIVWILLQGGVVALWRRRSGLRRVVPTSARDLRLVAGLLDRLEREPFAAAWLVERQRRLTSADESAARAVSRLRGLVSLLDSFSDNLFFVPIGRVLLVHEQLLLAIERWRQAFGKSIAAWLRAAGEIEAMTALACYAYERHTDPFPELVDRGVVFDATGLGHPLIADEVSVRNDLRLGDNAPQVLVVSGSNMSGKSTLLRAAGVNVALALAGAPVRAASLRLSQLSIGATLRIEDSLQEHRSRFYAEIVRIRDILDVAKSGRALLFLLDEILHGTNSYDRRIGAEAIVRGLVGYGAIGLVTTHDLALTEIVPSFGDAAANVHFEDRLEHGQMVFDYRMRPGVVEHSNALALMRAVGLEV
jgi:MutS-like protein